MSKGLIRTASVLALAFTSLAAAGDTLEEAFSDPPLQARTRCWWWWLNGNVTKEAITRELEEMKAKGMGGGMVFDADGSGQRGNTRVPAGPMYNTPEWRELFRHAMAEAARLGLEMGLSIQSGWNLGGPDVTPEQAAKQLTWSETRAPAGVSEKVVLPKPEHRNGFYRDIAVLAYKSKGADREVAIKASSQQSEFPCVRALDGSADTFWVSQGTKEGQGPSKEHPEWLLIEFDEPVEVSGVEIVGRKGYGPKSGTIAAGKNAQSMRTVQTFTLKDGEHRRIRFKPVTASAFKVLFEAAYDPRQPDNPRNVQVAQLALCGRNGKPLPGMKARRGIRHLELKAGFRELGGSAPDCRYLLEDIPATPGEEDVLLKDIVDLSGKMNSEGVLDWEAPGGEWTILRMGYTISNSHVSTSSGDWQGLVLDYMSKAIFNAYFDRHVKPILDEVKEHTGTTLKYMETDSWECGGMNWSGVYRDEFLRRRGYDPIPYLPIVAGKIVESRDVSNRFLADFRKTIADCVSDNHYATFAERAAEYGMGIQPESAGPHAGPLDGITNYSHSALAMSEFWVYSPHRPTPSNRFFVKQAASAANIYGIPLVGAESFTSIGPHWDDILWSSQKPSFDHEACAGLNLAFLHTFTSSPKEMGLPGQEYFAGTHFNPNVTWWDMSAGFFDYMNRCHALLQQGQFVADACYYYGDHVPNIAGRKEADPAGVLPEFDYDVINEETLCERMIVKDGKVVVPTGMAYRILVLPDHKVLSLDAMKAVHRLVKAGATVVGLKPEKTVSLVGFPESEAQFKAMAEEVWGSAPDDKGEHGFGKGKAVWARHGREFLLKSGVTPDFVFDGPKDADIHYIHRRSADWEFYFISNQQEKVVRGKAAFRVTGKQPELWDAMTGAISDAASFRIDKKTTTVPLELQGFGSVFVVFRKDAKSSSGTSEGWNAPVYETVMTLEGPWDVAFDPAWGAPESVAFRELTCWTQHPDEGVQHYSGTATYRKQFRFDESVTGKRLALNLGDLVQMARVRLNGRELGIAWSKPFRVEMTEALRKGENELEIDVVNNWVNRIVGDAKGVGGKQYTKTNIRRITAETPLQTSGLLGPVELESIQ